MGKIKITRKDAKNFCDCVLAIGYCELSALLYSHSPEFYNCGVYGWNWDLYIIDVKINGRNKRIGICTGYRSLVGYDVPYSIIKMYEEKAKSAKNSEEVENLLQDFCIECSK